MKKTLQKIVKTIRSNKFLIAIVFFVAWVVFIDSDNLIEQFSGRKRIRELEKEKQYYIEKIKEDSIKLNELKTNKKNLEKFAREQYFMKKENEDIYIIEFEE
jgi:cell division protein DivIC